MVVTSTRNNLGPQAGLIDIVLRFSHPPKLLIFRGVCWFYRATDGNPIPAVLLSLKSKQRLESPTAVAIAVFLQRLKENSRKRISDEYAFPPKAAQFMYFVEKAAWKLIFAICVFARFLPADLNRRRKLIRYRGESVGRELRENSELGWITNDASLSIFRNEWRTNIYTMKTFYDFWKIEIRDGWK